MTIPLNTIIHGDAPEVLKGIPADSFDSCVTDPPYGLGFMGKAWDKSGIANNVDLWREVLRVLKPGAHLLSFGGSRTYHRMACAIEDAGFEIRDQIQWIYASGFPKGRDIAWDIHKIACVSCGIMVAYDHERASHNSGRIEGTAGTAAGEVPPTEHGMRFVRASYLSTPVYACAECGQVLQPFMSEQESQSLRASWSKSETIWPEQSSMEGRGHLEASERKLQGCQVCSLSGGVFADGAEGWLRHGASACNGSIPWQVANQDGSRPSYRPQSREQLHRQSDAFRIERKAQAYRGYNVALKPAHEPICVARKPFKGTVAENVLQHGTGAINVDGCRIETQQSRPLIISKNGDSKACFGQGLNNSWQDPAGTILGRFPANVIHDGSDEVTALFPETQSRSSNTPQPIMTSKGIRGGAFGNDAARKPEGHPTHPEYLRGGFDDSGSAARFFYCAKASRDERGPGNNHPTVKPLALIQYLVKLVTPPGGIVLDPFCGSGTLGIAAGKLGMKWQGIELNPKYIEIAERRIEREVGLLLDMEAAHAD